MKLTRPDIGVCYCHPDAPNRCEWNSGVGRWIGPCADQPTEVDVELCADPDCWYVGEHYHPVAS